MSAVVPPEPHLEMLLIHLDRYRRGEINAVDADGIIARIARRLDRACWCEHQVCCQQHNKHSSPHKRCMLR